MWTVEGYSFYIAGGYIFMHTHIYRHLYMFGMSHQVQGTIKEISREKGNFPPSFMFGDWDRFSPASCI